MMSMLFDVKIDGFDCFFAALADDWPPHCLLMYDKESLHNTVGRPLDIDKGNYGEYNMRLHAVPCYR